jgi:cation transport ATPase
MDKTGTLTAGRPTAAELATAPGADPAEVLRLAAAVEQLSPHILAAAVVAEAGRRGLSPPAATDVAEEPGTAVTGRAEGHRVRVGQLAGEPPPWAHDLRARAEADGGATVWISVDDAVTGALTLQDPLRPEARQTVDRLRTAGLTRLVIVTGDHEPAAGRVGGAVGADEVVARCHPERKVERAREESRRAVTVMVGDGVNDAPALAAADVGVALGATGATGAAQVADAVLTSDRLGRLADAVETARAARRIAVQSATVGMALAVVAMGVAAAGRLPPIAGAVLQEGIDVLVIANALRALRAGPDPSRVSS